MKKAFLASIPMTLGSIALTIGYKTLLAHLIPKTKLALFFTLIDMLAFVMLLFVGFRSAMVVAYQQTQDDVTILNLFRLVLGAATLLSLLLMIPWINITFHEHLPWEELVVLVIAFSLYIYGSNQLSMYRRYTLMNILTVLEPCSVIASFGLAYFLGLRSYSLLFLSAVMGNLILVGIIHFAKHRHHPEPPFKLPPLTPQAKQFLRNAFIASAEFAAGVAVMYGAVMALASWGTPHELGDFQVVTKTLFMSLITLFVFPIFKFALPELSLLMSKNEKKTIQGYTRWIIRYALSVQALVTALIVIGGEKLITSLFGQDYHDAYGDILMLSSFIGLSILNGYAIALLRASGHFGTSFAVRLSGVLGFLMLILLLKDHFSVSNTVIFSLGFSYLPMTLLSLFLARKYL